MKTALKKYRVFSSLIDILYLFIGCILVCLFVYPTNIIQYLFDNTIVLTANDFLELAELVVLLFILFIIYLCLIPSVHNGQTLGMRLFKIRLVKQNGEDAKFDNYFYREIIGKIILTPLTLFVILIIDFIIFVYRRDNLSLFDILAKTKVVDAIDEE